MDKIKKPHHFDPKDNLIKDLIVLEEDGKLIYTPKNPQNSLRFMHHANYEIAGIER
jgi:hypothetical protein